MTTIGEGFAYHRWLQLRLIRAQCVPRLYPRELGSLDCWPMTLRTWLSGERGY